MQLNMKKREITPIAHIRTDFPEKFGIPRQSGLVPELLGEIVFEEEFKNDDALRGIEGFSHLWLIFDFSKAHREGFTPTVRPPRLGGNERIGVFASRSPFRPNSLGLSCVRLVEVRKGTKNGTTLVVGGADLLDMTPIYDIKPYIPYADCHIDSVGAYTETVPKKVLSVNVPDDVREILGGKLDAVTGCIAEDPRPSYQDDPERIYSMAFADFDIHFRVREGTAYIISVDERGEIK